MKEESLQETATLIQQTRITEGPPRCSRHIPAKPCQKGCEPELACTAVRGWNLPPEPQSKALGANCAPASLIFTPTPSLARYQEGGRDVFIYHWQKTAQPFVLACWGFQVCNNWVLNLWGQTPLTQWTDLEVELWSLRIYLLSVNAELLFYLPQFLLTPFRCMQQTNNEKYHAIFFVFFFFDT